MISYKLMLKIVTPLIMGGANPRELVFRISEIKGLLRYWYRLSNIVHLEMNTLRDRENTLFGSTSRASDIWLWGHIEGEVREWNYNRRRVNRNIWKVHRSIRNPGYWKGIKRAYASGSIIRINVGFYHFDGDKYLDFWKTLWAMVYMGGIGRRWKRALGSVYLDVEKSNIPSEVAHFFDITSLDELEKVKKFYCKGMSWVGLDEVVDIHYQLVKKDELLVQIVNTLDNISVYCGRVNGGSRKIALKWVKNLPLIGSDSFDYILIVVDASRIYKMQNDIQVVNCHGHR